MSLIFKLGFLLLFIGACNTEEKLTPVTSQVGAAPYFTPTEVISTLNALVTIIDWPADTSSIQKNLSVTPEAAKKLMLPLHPIWDEKINEVAALIPTWDQKKIFAVVSECAKKCECEFYQELLDRNPEILEKGNPELKNLSGLKIQKSKDTSITCAQNIPSIQSLLNHLQKELKNFDAESVI